MAVELLVCGQNLQWLRKAQVVSRQFAGAGGRRAFDPFLARGNAGADFGFRFNRSPAGGRMSLVNLEGVLGGVLLGMIVAVTSYTVSKRLLFEKFRLWAKAKNKWVGELVGCHWCLSFWFGMLANIFYFPRPLRMSETFLPIWMCVVADFVASWFFVAAVSSFLLSKTFDNCIRLIHVRSEEKKVPKEGDAVEEKRTKSTMLKILKRF